MFQSTLPRGERLPWRRSMVGQKRFQSTLPRGERQVAVTGYNHIRTVSIHAPTRGATSAPAYICNEINVSIHAPTRGATGETIEAAAKSVFQSTLPRGERPFYTRTCARAYTVSIHAPTRGATSTHTRIPLKSVFQSTLPRGERPKKPNNLKRTNYVSIHAPTRGAT